MADAQPRAVLITRPEPDASETARLLAERGFAPVIGPVMRLSLRRIAPPGHVDAVLVASRNAIPALPERLHSTPLLAVGGATAERARQAGFTSVLDADGDAAALTALASRTLPPGARLLLAHGAGQGDKLAAALETAGFAVLRRSAYAVTPARRMPASTLDALRSGRLDAAMFLSAETARAFVRLLPAGLAHCLTDVDAVAIGAAAAGALTPLPWRRVRVSVRPTLDEVLALL